MDPFAMVIIGLFVQNTEWTLHYKLTCVCVCVCVCVCLESHRCAFNCHRLSTHCVFVSMPCYVWQSIWHQVGRQVHSKPFRKSTPCKWTSRQSVNINNPNSQTSSNHHDRANNIRVLILITHQTRTLCNISWMFTRMMNWISIEWVTDIKLDEKFKA